MQLHVFIDEEFTYTRHVNEVIREGDVIFYRSVPFRVTRSCFVTEDIIAINITETGSTFYNKVFGYFKPLIAKIGI